MKTPILILITLFSAFNLCAQNPGFQWVKSNESYQGNSISYFIQTDSLNNIYTLGYFTGTIDFNPSPSQAHWLSAANNSYYIQKLGSNGNLIWVRQIDFTNGRPRQLFVSPAGRICVTGSFKDSVDIDPGPGVHMLYSNGGSDAFILKLSANGNFIWAKSFGGPEDDAVMDIVTDAQGNVYSHGSFKDTVDFDPGPGTFYYGTPYNAFNLAIPSAFIQKLDINGNFIWAKVFIVTGENGVCRGNLIDLDSSDNIVCAGFFSGKIDFDPGAGSYITPSGANGGYIVKLDSSGNFNWLKFSQHLPNTWGYYDPHALKTDRYNNVYTTGIFSGNVDFDPGPDTLLLSVSTFIQKYDENGNFLWAKSYGYGNEPLSLSVDTFGNIYSTGFFEDSTDLDPGPDTLIFHTNGLYSPTYGTYLQKLNSNGNLIWAGILQGNLGGSGGNDIFVDNNSNVFVAGSYGGTVDFDPGSGIHNKTSVSNGDAAYILKLSQCKTLTTDYQIACDSLTWMDSVTYYQSNHSAYFTLPSSTGCDSVICLSLTIPVIDTTVSVSTTGIFSANQSAASYQWLDCNNGLAALTGDTLKNFTPTANGSYAVAINVSGCMDTSACIPISNVGMEEIEGNNIKLYPNPNSGKFILDLGNLHYAEIRISNNLGQEIAILRGKKSNYFDMNLEPGVYFMEIRSKNGSKTIKFVVR